MEMEKDIIRGIAKTIIDGIKDAQMQIDYAYEAKEHGAHEIAAMHHAEAHKRIEGVKTWYDYAVNKMGKHEHDPAYEAMEDHYRDWARKIKERIGEFKA
jgi:hypothetical protein